LGSFSCFSSAIALFSAFLFSGFFYFSIEFCNGHAKR